MTGRSGRSGYLQRIAVHADARRRGFARTLIADALWWLRRHAVDRALVDTQLDNTAALSLYESCGFRRLPVGLCVLGRTLRRAVVVVLTSAAVLVLGVMPVGAGVDPPSTTADTTRDAPRLVLTGQPAWVTVGGNLPLRLQVRGQAAGTPGLIVSATAHEAVSSRSGFEAALEGRSLGSVLGQAEPALDPFPAEDDGSRTLTFPLQAERRAARVDPLAAAPHRRRTRSRWSCASPTGPGWPASSPRSSPWRRVRTKGRASGSVSGSAGSCR